MSRSFKKHPINKAKSRYAQKRAARNFRRNVNLEEEIPNGNFYKRTYPMWDVIDYSWRSTFKDYINTVGWHSSGRTRVVEDTNYYLHTKMTPNKGVKAEEYLIDENGDKNFVKTIFYKNEVEEKVINIEMVESITYKTSTEEEKERLYLKWKKDTLRK